MNKNTKHKDLNYYYWKAKLIKNSKQKTRIDLMDPADSQSPNKQQKVGENGTMYTLRPNR